MKRILTVATLLLATISMNAQDKNYKPVPGTITAEVGLGGGLNNANFTLNSGSTGSPSREGVLRFRYFNSADLGFRVGFAVRNDKNEAKTATGIPTNEFATTVVKGNGFEINVGVEKHLTGTNRLSTYIGGDILFGMKRYAYDVNYSNGDYVQITNSNGSGLRSANTIGLRLITGADYYIARKLYLGTEVGINIVSGKTKKDVYKTKTGSVVTETPNGEPGKTFNITPAIITGIRIGYQF